MSDPGWVSRSSRTSWIGTASELPAVVADPVLTQLLDAARVGVEEDERSALRLLLADFLACAAAGATEPVDPPAIGTLECGVEWARWASRQDLDDVDWQSLVHTGSVVMPAVLAAATHQVQMGDIASAIAVGYRVTGELAVILGSVYRPAWHATAICGVVGAAAAVAVLEGLDGYGLESAISFASLVAAGRTQAVTARNGAASFNRQVAVTSALLAAQAARRRDPCVAKPFTGEGGLATALGLDSVEMGVGHHAGLRSASVRLFPVTGFAHGAVLAASALTVPDRSSVRTLRVKVAAAAERMSLADTNGWWDIPAAVARAYATGDPFATGAPMAGQTPRVILESANLGVACAEVVAEADDGPCASLSAAAPGSVTAEQTQALWQAKCRRVLRVDPASAVELAGQILAGDREIATVDALTEAIRSLSDDVGA